jgi:hypothetical protein
MYEFGRSDIARIHVDIQLDVTFSLELRLRFLRRQTMTP